LPHDYMPGLMANAPDGSLWLSDGRKEVLWHVLKNGDVPPPITIGRTTLGIAVDSEGTIWASHPKKSEITRYTSDGSVRAGWDVTRRRPSNPAPLAPPPPMQPPGTPVKPKPIPVAPKTTPKVTDKLQKKPPPAGPDPTYLAFGPNQELWFSVPSRRSIGRIMTDGDVLRYQLPSELGEPRRIIAGPDGAMWFIVASPAVLGRITTDADVSSVAIPAPATAIAADSKGRIWFAAAGNIAGTIDKDGNVTEMHLPGPDRLIRSMAEGPDGAMWFADQKNKVIGRIKN